MKDKTRLKLKIVSSFLTCLLSLFSIVALTFSWFAANDDADGEGMTVEGTTDSDVLATEFYYVEKGVGGYGLKKVEGEPTLGVYDALGEGYSLAVKIYISRQSGDKTVKLTSTTTATYFLGDNGYPLLPPKIGDVKKPDDVGKGYTNSMTSIISMTVLTLDEIDALNSSSLSALPSGDRMSSFIDLNAASGDGGRRPTRTISLVQSTSTDSLTTRREDKTIGGKECDSIYAFLTYDSLLVNTVFSANIGNDNMYVSDENGDVYPIPFICDFTLKAEIT